MYYYLPRYCFKWYLVNVAKFNKKIAMLLGGSNSIRQLRLKCVNHNLIFNIKNT